MGISNKIFGKLSQFYTLLLFFLKFHNEIKLIFMNAFKKYYFMLLNFILFNIQIIISN